MKLDYYATKGKLLGNLHQRMKLVDELAEKEVNGSRRLTPALYCAIRDLVHEVARYETDKHSRVSQASGSKRK